MEIRGERMKQTNPEKMIHRGLFAVIFIILLAVAMSGVQAATSIRLNPSSTYIDMFGTLNMTSNKIVNLVDPSGDQDAATKKYVDTALTGGASGWSYTSPVVRLTTKTNEINMTSMYVNNTNSRVGIGTENPQAKLQVTGDEVRIGDSGSPSQATGDGDLFVENTLEVGGTIYGSGAGLTGITSGAVNDNWVNESGDRMTGALNMTNHQIVKLAEPSLSTDAATKNYVDTKITAKGGSASGWNDTGKQVKLLTKTDWMNATTLFVNNSNDRVGIGTYHPGYMLEVNGGDAFFGENVYLGDANTFANTNGQITLGSNDWIGIGSSAERIAFDGAGNIAIMNAKVGIGTAAPVQQLVVVGKANVTSNLTMGGAIQLKNKRITGLAEPAVSTDAATRNYVDTQISASPSGWTDTGAVVKLSAKTDEVNMTTMYVNNTNSRIGIRTENPTATLNVVGNTNLNNTLYVNKTSDYVGIGTANPRQKLHVVGKVNITSNLTMGGAIQLKTKRITGVDTPINPNDAVPKTYVDTQITSASGWSTSGGVVKLTTKTNEVNMTNLYVNNTNSRIGIRTENPTATLNVVGNTNLNNTLYVNKTSDYVGIGTSHPRQKLHVVGKLNLTSNLTMGGAIQMKAQRITGVLDPAQAQDAATKNYVDTHAPGSAAGWSYSSPVVKLTTKTDEVNMTTLYVNNSDSRVGIRTESPTATLNVVGNVNLNNTLYVNKTTDYVGIGTSHPKEKLDVKGTASTGTYLDTYTKLLVDDTDARIQVTSTDSGSYGSAVILSSGTRNWGVMAQAGGDSYKFHIGYRLSSGTEDMLAGSSQYLTIDTSGNVGIGTSSPTYKLQVVGNVNLNNTLYVNKTSDRVGIGKANPRSKLEVSDGTSSITLDPVASTPTMNTTNNKNLIITSDSGNVIIKIG